MARQGVSQRLAQELMRHSDPKLTANLYTDAAHLPTFEAVNAMDWSFSEKENIPPQKVQFDCPDLTKIFNAWDGLPQNIKTAILTMVEMGSPS